jgi:exodeoxyribonuclease V gamma subunit
LEQYKLKEQQFEYALYGKSLPKLFAKMQANGELPLGEFAPLIFKQNLPDMEDLASLVQAHFAFEVEAVHVQLCFAKGTPKEK